MAVEGNSGCLVSTLSQRHIHYHKQKINKNTKTATQKLNETREENSKGQSPLPGIGNEDCLPSKPVVSHLVTSMLCQASLFPPDYMQKQFLEMYTLNSDLSLSSNRKLL